MEVLPFSGADLHISQLKLPDHQQGTKRATTEGGIHRTLIQAGQMKMALSSMSRMRSVHLRLVESAIRKYFGFQDFSVLDTKYKDRVFKHLSHFLIFDQTGLARSKPATGRHHVPPLWSTVAVDSPWTTRVVGWLGWPFFCSFSVCVQRKSQIFGRFAASAVWRFCQNFQWLQVNEHVCFSSGSSRPSSIGKQKAHVSWFWNWTISDSSNHPSMVEETFWEKFLKGTLIFATSLLECKTAPIC